MPPLRASTALHGSVLGFHSSFFAEPDSAFDFDADPDIAYHTDADRASQNHVDPHADPDPQHWLNQHFIHFFYGTVPVLILF